MYWNTPGFEETKKDFGENTHGYVTPNNDMKQFQQIQEANSKPKLEIFPNLPSHQEEVNHLIDMIQLMQQQKKLSQFGPQPIAKSKNNKYAINPHNCKPLSKRYFQVYQTRLMEPEQRDFLLDQYQLRKKILGLQLELETQFQIKEALQQKYEVVENQNQYLQRLLVDPDKQVHLERENKLVRVQGEKVQMHAQFQESIAKKNQEINALTEERNQLVTENYVLQKKIQEKVFEHEPVENKEFYYSMIELRLTLENKNLLIEKLHSKLEEFLMNPFWQKQELENEQNTQIQQRKNQFRIQDIQEIMQSSYDRIQEDYQQQQQLDNSQQQQQSNRTTESLVQTVKKPYNNGLQYQQQQLQQQNQQKPQQIQNPQFNNTNKSQLFNKQLSTSQHKENNNEFIQDLERKYNELEELLVTKNKEIKDLKQQKKHFELTVYEVYETLKVYYKEIIEDPETQEKYLQKVEEAYKQEKLGQQKLNDILQEILLNYRGIEVKVQSEIHENKLKMKQLEQNIHKREQEQQEEQDMAKQEIITSLHKLQEAQEMIKDQEFQIQQLNQDKENIIQEFEQSKQLLLQKVSELNAEVARILQKSDQEVSKIKIENFKNKKQVTQLMAMLTEREKEIAALRLKFAQNDEELKRLRKRNISLNGDVTFSRPHICQQLNNKSGINLSSITPQKSLHSSNAFQKEKVGISLPNICKRHRGKSMHSSNLNLQKENPEQLGDGDPYFKIRFIRTLKEWAVYWKYYNQNHQYKLQLLDKMLTTQKLRDEFADASDIKMRILKDAISSQEEDMFETVIHLLAELIDINKLSKEELEDLDIGPRVVRSLRVPKDQEDQREYTNLQISGLKILSFMDHQNMYWSQHMSEELMNVNGLKPLSDCVKQTKKQLVRMLALNTLHLIASSKQLISFMISYKITSDLLLKSEDINEENQIASLALLSALLKDEQFINSITDVKGLLKLQELLFSDNNGIVANSILCIDALIPNFNYHKSMYKEKYLHRVGEISGTSIVTKTRLHGLKLIKNLKDRGTEMEVDQINEIIMPQLLQNIILPHGETLTEITPERDLILQTIKLKSSLIEDFAHPQEEKLIQYLLKLLICKEIKNDVKVEKNVIELLFKLWKSSEDLIIKQMLQPDIIIAICDRYMKRTTNDDLVTYGLMLVGICEQQKINHILVQERGDTLINYLLENSRHNDYKVALTAQRLLLFVSLEKSSFGFFKQSHIQQIIKLIKREKITDDFLQMGLDIVFNLMKSPTLFQQFYASDIFNLIFQLVFFKKKTDTKVVQNAFSCIEMIILQSLPDRKEFRERFITNSKIGYKYLQSLLKTSLLQNDREFGKHVHFIFKHLHEESKDKFLIKNIYNQSDDYIKTMVQAKFNFAESTPENSKEITSSLQHLSFKSEALQQILSKYEKIYQQQNGVYNDEDDIAD